jgi:putative protease
MEIMAPAGSFESLMAAIQAGADSVYFGVGRLNMRSRSSLNFTLQDLEQICRVCEDAGVRTYLTLNTIIYDQELDEMRAVADAAKAAGITAVIASDISVLEYCKRIGLEIHISTQCNITNLEAVRFYAAYADVMVLARECSLEQMGAITRQIREEHINGPSGKLVAIEVFAHGALCMAISGKCYLSLGHFNQSANRGACYQPCRRSYEVFDKENEVHLEIDHEYIMSPKDLCTIDFLDRIAKAGVKVLKIEGRGRSADYVKTVTACYREAAEAIARGTYTRELVNVWLERLKSVYNRGFWGGYYLGATLGEWSEKYGSQATRQKVYVGRVTNYFSKLQVAEVHIDTNDLCQGDDLIITGTTTGVEELHIEEIRLEDVTVSFAEKGVDCSFPCPTLVRRGDKVYKLVSPSEE